MRKLINQRLGLWRSQLLYHGNPFQKRRLVQFYQPFIQPGDLCFDIGSHVGSRLAAWTKLGARVLALEPQPQMMSHLENRFGHRSDIILVQEAVGAAMGYSQLFISTRFPTVTSLSQSWIDIMKKEQSFAGVDWDRQVTVKVTTLDRLIAEHGSPSLCKIDVEGYELQVLQGLSYPIPTISFEYLPAALTLAHACIAELHRIGSYRFNWSVGESHRLQSQTWLNTQDMLDHLSDKLAHGRSGDIYARLQPLPIT